MSVTVTRIDNSFAAEIGGVDIAKPLAEADVAAIRAANLDYPVMVFRAPGLTDEQQIAFTESFGAMENIQIRTTHARRTTDVRVADMSNVDPEGNLVADDSEKLIFQRLNRYWHSDSSFKPVPSGPSLLHCREIPSEGGNTEFANLADAYDALDEAMKERLEGLVAEHSLVHSRAMLGYRDFNEQEKGNFPPVLQAVVRRHPATGRKSLYLGSHASHIVGWDVEEGRALLGELLEFATQPQFVYSHPWTVGDLVWWDNISLLHRAAPYPDRSERRILRRTTLAGAMPTVKDGRPVDEWEAATAA